MGGRGEESVGESGIARGRGDLFGKVDVLLLLWLKRGCEGAVLDLRQ